MNSLVPGRPVSRNHSGPLSLSKRRSISKDGQHNRSRNGYAVRPLISTCASTEKADRYGCGSLGGPGLKSSLRRSGTLLIIGIRTPNRTHDLIIPIEKTMPQVSIQEFERLPLRVHTFLAEVPLHDVWFVDLPRWRSGVTLDEFLRTPSNDKLNTCGCSESSSLFTSSLL